MMIKKEKKSPAPKGETGQNTLKEVNMKYEVLKEILEKITQIEKTFQNLSNPITHISPKK